MISIYESAEIGGVLGRTATMAIPIPGAGIILSRLGLLLEKKLG